jgi:hypothetical protein
MYMCVCVCVYVCTFCVTCLPPKGGSSRGSGCLWRLKILLLLALHADSICLRVGKKRQEDERDSR